MPDMTAFEEKVIEKPAEKLSISEAFNKEDELGVSVEYELEDSSIVADLTQSVFELPALGDKQVEAVENKPEQVVPPQMVFQAPVTTPTPVVEEPKVEMDPREIYLLQAAVEDGKLRQGLLTLCDFGFTDFARNKELLDTFQNNIEQVIENLLDEQSLYN